MLHVGSKRSTLGMDEADISKLCQHILTVRYLAYGCSGWLRNCS